MALSNEAAEPFVWGAGGAQLTPEEIARRRQMAQALAAQGMDTSPVGHWAQGAARVAQGLVGGLEERKADRAEQANARYSNDLIAAMMAAESGAAQPAPASPAPVAAPAPAAATPAEPPRQAAAPNQVASLGGGVPAAAPAGGRIPAAIRTNNPGAMWPGPSATRFGSTGHEVLNDGQGNKIAKFDSPEQGAAAQFDLLGRRYTGMQLADAIRKWSGGNSSNAYTASVAQAMGMAPTDVLSTDILADPAKAIPLARAMARIEAGRDYPMSDDQWRRGYDMYAGGGAADPKMKVAQALAPHLQGQPPEASPGAVRVAQALPPKLMEALTSPYVSPQVKAIAQAMLARQPKPVTPEEQQMQQLQIQKLQRELQAPPPDSRPSGIREYEYAKGQGFAGTYQDWQVGMKEAGRPSTSVNIDQKAQGALEKTFGEQMGKTFGAMYDEGVQANQDLAQIDRLRGLLGQSGSGLGPALTTIAAGFGIQLGEGAGPGQAAKAIISYLTPRQRVAGSGASSDADLAMFKAALPSMMNTPAGNNLIIDTMQGLAEHKRAMGDIAGLVAMQEIEPKEALARIRALPDPYAKFKAAQGQQPGGKEESDGWMTLPNGVRVRRKGQ